MVLITTSSLCCPNNRPFALQCARAWRALGALPLRARPLACAHALLALGALLASAVLSQACERPSKQIQSTTNINNNKRSTKTKHKTTTKAQYKTIRRTLARLARSWRAPSPYAAHRVRARALGAWRSPGALGARPAHVARSWRPLRAPC